MEKITYREVIKTFLLFLKNNNAIKPYKNAIYSQRKHYFKTLTHHINLFTIEPLNEIIKRKNYSELINLPFVWSRTIEGYSFWATLDAKWRNIIYK